MFPSPTDSPEKTQPRSQGLLRHVVATAWFSPEPSFLSLVAQVLEYKCNLCHHSVFAETNPLNLANSIRRSERPGKSDATWEKEQPRRRLGYPDERVTSQHTLSGEGYVCLPPQIHPHLTLRPGLPSFPSSPSSPAGPCRQGKGISGCCTISGRLTQPLGSLCLLPSSHPCHTCVRSHRHSCHPSYLPGPEGTHSPESQEGLVAQGNQASLMDLESLHCPETRTPSEIRAKGITDPWKSGHLAPSPSSVLA